ncbi:MAG: carbohydrate ABC transporter permease [Ruminococcus sp.]|nr:carbohydrate ABC transporter permease [Ruminococcus sp.]
MSGKTDVKKIKATSGQAGKKHGGTAAIFVFLLAVGIFMLFPIYLTLVMSVKPVEELFVFPPKLYTLRPTLDNFSDMFRDLHSNRVPFSRYVANSITVTLTVTLLQCITGSMAAFVLAKCRFPGSKAINSIIVVSLLYQSNVIYIMQYIVMAKLHLIDNPLALILPSVASPMTLFLMRQSISQMPDSVIDAAKVDGAGLFRICWQIVIPNQKPALMTLIIFAFQGAWNIQSGAFVFQEQYKTLPTVVSQAAASGMAKAGVAMAAAVFMLVPPVVIFMLAQRQVIETMANSGIKE